ncbi:conserved exported hypothetical protein [Crenothrix polyspora]|uniref:Lcl C-terminal domain-containing protein n=1 Tax=Crenothrix polyspora TaxID=360316 RepID=A0A1R4H1L8_9GAMM|nr:DUF1566 domain-containing protein [Crenothrix polyspora]SJM90102.1 conserved exported hypothetical protein [Crenothrix polyspora]
MYKPYQKNLIAFLLTIPCISLAQTCNTANLAATTPTSQFTDNNNGTVTDKKTGLIWKKCSEGQTWNSGTGNCDNSAQLSNWQIVFNAIQTVNNTGFAGQTDWRLPNIKELASILEEQCYSPAINLSVFPNTPSQWYCASTHYVTPGASWEISFNDGNSGRNPNSNYSYIRLVRGG